MKSPGQIIDELGGTGVVAQACEVTPGAVSQWRDHGIPKAQWKFLAATNPSVFKGLEWEGTDYSSKAAA
jgi:hypothetical protein